MSLIGRSVKRLEDRPLLTGSGRFAADVMVPDMLYMRVVCSPVAFGRLAGLRIAEALAHPGTVAVWTAEDVADIPPIGFRMTSVPGLEPYRQPVLANGHVRYVGEPIAAVFAADPYMAEDIADLVAPEIEPLAPCLDPAASPSEFAPGRNTEAAVITKAYGDLDAAFAGAHAVVALELTIGRHSGVPLETRGAIAVPEAASGILRMYGAAKVPHYNRQALATMLGLPLDRIHLHEGHVGGGFGIRGELYPEDVLTCAAALQLGRPVKWIEDRYEHLVAANQSRGSVHRVRAAVDEHGFILGLDDEFWFDQGGYLRTHGVTVIDLTCAMLPGPYMIPAYRSVGHVRLTNKTPCGTYRAPGRFESTFVRERLMDAIAARLSIDRIDVRRRNLIGKEEMPYGRPLATLSTEVVLDSGDYAGLLDKALAAVKWSDLQGDLERRRARGECVGAGLALFVEKSGLGPFDGVRVAVDTSSVVEVVTGAASLGQGLETVVAQICADALGVDYRRVRVVHGRTDRIPFGMGAFASRATVMTGEATRLAALEVRAKATEVAAELMQQDADALAVVDGKVVCKGAAGPSMTLGEIAAALEPASKLRGTRAPGLSAEGWFYTDHMNYPYGVHIAVAKVDRETGGVTIERYLLAYDVGRAVNPMLIEGQLAGGFAQGVGGALLEEFLYDERGEPLSVNFADYLMPTAREVPALDVLITEDAPSPLNPLGLKGAGEGGVNAVGAAVAAAIDDAVGIPGAITRLPVTPQRLRAILEHGR